MFPNSTALFALSVARSTRAWIETGIGRFRCLSTWVARSTRAWIETLSKPQRFFSLMVARSTRAWIETMALEKGRISAASHALRVRGLKRLRLPLNQQVRCRTLYACVD